MAGRSCTTSQASPFTQAVVSSMRQLYPEELADKSFDNTGLLLEAPYDASRPQKHTALLAVDLTRAVADEAIARKDSIVIAYHPVIFRGLKALTLANSQQETLLRLAREGISVYCPHTAIDAAAAGLGPWLADVVTGNLLAREYQPAPATNAPAPIPDIPGLYTDIAFPNALTALPPHLVPYHSSTILHPITPPTATPTGTGRLVTLATPTPLSQLLTNIGLGLGQPSALSVAVPQAARSLAEFRICTVAVCAGSGSSVFAGVDADLFVTGEMSHHEALAVVERGSVVVCTGHGVSERGFLGRVREALREALGEELKKEAFEAIGEVGVGISAVDRDPFGWVVRR